MRIMKVSWDEAMATPLNVVQRQMDFHNEETEAAERKRIKNAKSQQR